MMERASSIENITGYDHPDESFAKHIQRLEDKTFYYLKMCYIHLEHFIQKNTRHHEETILQKMMINPSFLAPTTITNHPYTPSTFVPMEVFCKDYITQTAFIPAVLEICLEHHFYPYSECGGLLTSFSVYGRPKRDTNVLIEVMNLNNTRLTSRLFQPISSMVTSYNNPTLLVISIIQAIERLLMSLDTETIVSFSAR